jgi:hypothetical protein
MSDDLNYCLSFLTGFQQVKEWRDLAWEAGINDAAADGDDKTVVRNTTR